ncbi:cell surface protein [Leptospira wolffii]|uniref:YncE family protein n=1 Tax=Leptospira wolffii TaxID=409998 RepID=UPI0010839EB4|nr:cell surface protein [Leptospira wolffii]TGL44048.1 cell surface protein [Leptospira wolffii]
MKSLRTIFYILFFSCLTNCTVSKSSGTAEAMVAMGLLSSNQTQALAYVSNEGGSYGVNAINRTNSGEVSLYPAISPLGLPTGILATGTGSGHIIVSIPGSNSIQIIDARQSNPILKTLNVGTKPGRLYPDPVISHHSWLMNDGDGTGADPILCPSQPTKGSFSVIHDSMDPVALAHVHASVCVGLGPHEAASQTMAPYLGLVTNQGDNTISVVNNDMSSATFLSSTLLNTISLSGTPKGIVYSAHTNKFYTYLSSGTGSIAVIDPTGNGNTGALATGINNVGTKYNILKIDSTGRYLILSGTDTSASPNKGLLLSIDLHMGSLGTPISVNGTGFSDIQLTPDGMFLVVASASSDSGTATDQFYVYDTSALPELTLSKKIAVGSTNQSYRSFSFLTSGSSLLGGIVPNYNNGTITVFNPGLDPVGTLTVGGNPSYTTVFSPGSSGSMDMGGMHGM